MIQINLSFLEIEIEKIIGEVPRLRFRLNVQVGRLSEIMFTRVQFNRISFNLDLNSGRDPTYTQKIAYLGTYESLEPVSCLQNSNTYVFFSLPLNTSIIEKMLEIRNNENFI